MTPAQKQVHEKLMRDLPVREHRAYDDVEVRERKKRQPTHPRPVIFKGRKYPSLTACSNALRRSRQYVGWLLKTGKARYA